MPPDGFSYPKGTAKKFMRSDIEQAVTRDFARDAALI
jgi:hypothetical protein